MAQVRFLPLVMTEARHVRWASYVTGDMAGSGHPMTINLRRARNLQIWLLGTLLVVGAVAVAILLSTVKSGYNELLTRSLEGTQDQARVVQVTFKKQVQSWKDILLRGRDPEQFKKYVAQFQDEEKRVRELGTKLRGSLTGDPQAQQLLDSFLAQHATLGSNYGASLRAFEASKQLDYQASDAM